eukprot:900693-Alexandrium_andersonii.AAC.1
MAGHPEAPPGLDPEAPRPKRTRASSVGASPSASSPPITSYLTSVPTAYGPPGPVGDYQRAPGDQAPRPPQASSDAARESERASASSGWNSAHS